MFDTTYARAYKVDMSISDRLNEAMILARIPSQNALFRASGVPQPTINRILKGTGKNGPETETLRKLAVACGVRFEWLNEGLGAPRDGPVRRGPIAVQAPAEQMPNLIYASADEERLLTLYREADDLGRNIIISNAESVDKRAGLPQWDKI
jgi:transcriptional regulator with XRE-family HTH domain